MHELSKKFFEAVYLNRPRLVQAIIKKGKVDPDISDEGTTNGRTALLFACERQYVDLARALLTGKPRAADVDKADNEGRRPVWWAAAHGNSELGELLINEFKCDVNIFDEKTGFTPLYRAILSDSAEVCSILVKAGADVNAKQKSSNTKNVSPLLKAIQIDNLEICRILVSVNSGCDLNHQNELGFTALHYAVAYRRYDITGLLMNSRIKKYVPSNRGVTAMTIAVEHSNSAMVKTLAAHRYNINKVYKWKETPLEHAISLHSEDCAIALVHWGCRLDRAAGKPSYFRMAAENGLINLLQLLIQINPRNLREKWIRKEDWPLALASQPKMCKLLWALGKNPPPLKNLSRAVVFRCVKSFPSRFRQLSLPKDVAEFLSFSEVVNERIYEELPLTEDCPFDCDPLHAWRDVKCADIEINNV